MRKAPKDAYYVWMNNRLYYPRKLAAQAGRDDLRIIPASDLIDIARFAGLFPTNFVIDHAAEPKLEALLHLQRNGHTIWLLQ
jgi:hypothetical protein